MVDENLRGMKNVFTEKGDPKVSIVIPTYNRKNDVLECLKSVCELSYPNYEIIVVDNNSNDGTSEAIKKLYPNVKLIKTDENLGVTGGRNLGGKNSSGEYILFLDHDTIIDKNALSELVSVLQKYPGVGACGPIIYSYFDPDKIWSAGTSINTLTGMVYFSEKKSYDKIMEVQVLPTAFLVRKEVIEKIGWFDDIYFAVYEDADLCFKIREIGYKVVCVPEAKVWHKVPMSKYESIEKVLNRSYYVSRNKIIFMRKHVKTSRFIVFMFFFLPLYIIYYFIMALFLRKPRSLLNYWRGTFSGLHFALRYRAYR